MREPQTYSLSELEAQSGIDKRTIAYYVQEGLLPKVGRRGPRTRYPKEILERLMFIRRVRELQDSGTLRAVTLSEIRDAIGRLPQSEIRSGKGVRMSAERIRQLFVEPDWDTTTMAMSGAPPPPDESTVLSQAVEEAEFSPSSGMAPASRRRIAIGSRLTGRQPHGEASAFSTRLGAAREVPPGAELSDVSEQLLVLLQEIERRAIAGATSTEGTTLERLIRVPITESIALSVRNISEEDAELVEQLAQLLRRVGGL